MTELKKISAQNAQEVLDRYEPEETLKEFLEAQPASKSYPPNLFIDALMQQQQHLDVVKFLAHALPKREAVWWSCLCAQVAVADGAKETVKAALNTAEAWVTAPSEALRREAESLAKLTEFAHSASWAAQAAFWAGGSITPASEPAVPPPPYLYAHAVYGAIALASALADPDAAAERVAIFIQQGLDIAQGGRGETPATAATLEAV